MKAKEEKEKDSLAKYLTKQKQDNERENKLRMERHRSMEDIKHHAEEKNNQKERILKQAEERMQRRIDSLLEKQKQADERLEKQKEQERIRKILRQEFITLNNQSKQFNR